MYSDFGNIQSEPSDFEVAFFWLGRPCDCEIFRFWKYEAFPRRVLVRSNQKLGCFEVRTMRRHLYPTRASGNKTKIRCYRARSADLSNSKRSANKSPDKNARQLSLLHLYWRTAEPFISVVPRLSWKTRYHTYHNLADYRELQHDGNRFWMPPIIQRVT